MPLSNLLDRTIGMKARSNDDANASTLFEIDLSSAQGVRVLAFVSHNLSSGATYRIRASNTSGGYGSPLYDSGTLGVWEPSYFSSLVEWEDDTFWDTAGDLSGLTGGQPTLIHIMSTATTARYWYVEFFDSANPDSYVEIGRLFVSNAFAPEINMDFGVSLGYTDESSIETAWSGTEYFDTRTTRRTATLRLSALSDTEAWNSILDMQRLQGITGEVLFIWDPDDTVYSQRRSFLARNESLSPIEAVRYGANAVTIKLRELI